MGYQQFTIKCFGCPRRDVDAERIANYLVANGLKRTSSDEEADYLVVITCGLTQKQANDSINCIVDFQKCKGRIFVYGCLPAMDPEKVKAVYQDRALLTKDIEQLDDFFNLPIKFKDIPDANKAIQPLSYFQKIKIKRESIIGYLPKVIEILKHRLYSFLKKPSVEGLPGGIGFDNKFFTLRIAEGCAGSCSYCTIKKAIGRVRSKPVPVILHELRAGLLKKNYRINIISSDTGAYGVDIGSSLPELLSAILNENSKITIEFIQDLHPYWICRYKEEMLKLIETKRIKSILTAVQSGDERILRLMNRHMEINEFTCVIRQMKEIYPQLRLRTQVIVGFPAETEEGVDATITFLKKSKFDEIDLFAYYEVKGADSENITPKVPRDIILQRILRMEKSLNVAHRVIT
jgi:tRNA A37 methylthiotransferase MiaB